MRLFAMSALLNLALVAIAAWLWSRSQQRPTVAVDENDAATVAATPERVAASSSTETNQPAAAIFSTNRFGWSQIETNDFAQLAANLRAIGCPEATVRELILARAQRALARVDRATMPKLAFWTGGLRRTRAKKSWDQEAAKRREQIVASVERAIGPNTFVEDNKMLSDFTGQAIARFMLGPMSEDKFLKLSTEISRYDTEKNKARYREDGIYLDDDEAALKAQQGKLRQSLKSFLSPSEFEEMTARLGMMRLADSVAFAATTLSSREVREVALIQSRINDSLGEGLFSERSMNDEETAQFKSELHRYLGDAKFAQFERATDNDFKAIFEVTLETDLTPDVAVKAYDIRKSVLDEVKRLRADTSLSDADREQQLSRIQAETEGAMQKVLGEQALGAYLNRGGAWLTNVGGL